jgi:long-chain acyl-CoA synthetase
MADSLADFFFENFRAHAHECAYRQRRGYRTESFTHEEVLAMASSFAHALEARGIVKGDRVMLWGENSAEWVAAFFGCALRGVIVVPMDDAASADFATRVLQQVKAKLVVASRTHVPDCAAAAVPAMTFEELVPSRTPLNEDPSLLNLAAKRDDTLQIVFTSGTTAEPRGVIITHGNVLANIAPLEREMQAYLKYERVVHPLRFLNLLPLSHVFGQFLGMFLPPLLGGTVIFQDELKPSEVVNTIRRERVSVLVSVPRILQSLKQKIERDLEEPGEAAAFRQRFAAAKEKHFLHRWWIFRAIRRQFGWKFLAMISGGAALDSETEEFWGRLGYAVIQGYGLTETTSLVSVNHPFKLGKGSIGKVLPGREVKLADDGEILVRGAGVTSGYWDGGSVQENTRTILPAISDGVSDRASGEEGWYRTGDIGALDKAGNLYFKGRKKEVIVTPAGMNIYPEDLEAVLRRQPEVKDCVVVGMDRGGNAEPCAVLILRDESSPGEIVQRVNQSLAEYQRMRTWMVWPQEDFPRTGTQKARRNVIAEAVRERMSRKLPPSAKSAEGWGNHIEKSGRGNERDSDPLADLIARVSGRTIANLSEDAGLESDLGLSSLDRVELLSAVEDRYQVDLSETRFSAVRTVRDLERMLHGEAAPATVYHYPRWTLGWPVTWLRWLAHYLLMRPAVILLGWPRIEGRERLRGVGGPLLVVSNHIGDVDPGFILTALPARFRNRLATATGGEALEALRTPSSDRNFLLRMYDGMQWMLGVSLLNLFPLPREAGFRRSFAYAGEAVDRGYSILVFPEGRHTTDGKMNPFRAGIGLLAVNLGIPVLPMRIDGLYEAKAAGRWFVAPRSIGVKIGKPIQFEPETKPEQIAAQLQRAVQDL